MRGRGHAYSSALRVRGVDADTRRGAGEQSARLPELGGGQRRPHDEGQVHESRGHLDLSAGQLVRVVLFAGSEGQPS